MFATTALRAIAAACLLIMMPGCAGEVGPSVRQGREGQTLSNSTLNAATFIDGTAEHDPNATDEESSSGRSPVPGVTTFNSAGPIRIITQSAKGTQAQSAGMVTRTLTIDREGTKTKMVLDSGSDAEGDITADPTTGHVTRFTFKTNSSEPLRALGENVALYQDTIKALSADQRAVYIEQSQAFVKTVEAVNPTLAAVLKGLLGIP